MADARGLGFVTCDPDSDLVVHLTESQNRLYAFILRRCPTPMPPATSSRRPIWSSGSRPASIVRPRASGPGPARLRERKSWPIFAIAGETAWFLTDDLVESLALVAEHVAEEDDLRNSKLRMSRQTAARQAGVACQTLCLQGVDLRLGPAARQEQCRGQELLYRLRETLLNCIQRKLAEAEAQ